MDDNVLGRILNLHEFTPKNVQWCLDVGNDVLSCHSGLSFSANSASRILYTCSAQDEPDYETALGALDLAHRWQVEAVVAILTDLLAGA